MTRRPFNRYYPLPVQDVSPQSLSFDGTKDTGVKVGLARSAPLLCTTDQIVLVGAPQLARHLKIRPQSTIKAIELDGLTSTEREALQLYDSVIPPLTSQQIIAITALRRLRMPLKQIVDCLPHLADLSTASTLISLGFADPYLIKLMDKEAISLQHAKQLFSLSEADQCLWAGKVVTEKLSVADLRKRLRKQSPAPDLQETVRNLEQAFGTQVAVSMEGKNAKITVSVTWTTVLELQGIMERIGAAPMPETSIPTTGRPRSLTVELDSNDEFDMFVGHLLPAG